MPHGRDAKTRLKIAKTIRFGPKGVEQLRPDRLNHNFRLIRPQLEEDILATHQSLRIPVISKMKRKAAENGEGNGSKTKRRAITDKDAMQCFRPNLFDESVSKEYRLSYASSEPYAECFHATTTLLS